RGWLRPPKKLVRPPCVGQMDGVALASCTRRSTSRRTKFSWLSRPWSRSRSAPKVSSGDVSDVENTLDALDTVDGVEGVDGVDAVDGKGLSTGPPVARCRTGAGSFAIARAAAGSMLERAPMSSMAPSSD